MACVPHEASICFNWQWLDHVHLPLRGMLLLVPLIGGMSGIFIWLVWTTCKYSFASLFHSHISSVPYPKNLFVTVKVNFSRIFDLYCAPSHPTPTLSQRDCQGHDGVSHSKPMHLGIACLFLSLSKAPTFACTISQLSLPHPKHPYFCA
jgi:hypothetical protein